MSQPHGGTGSVIGGDPLEALAQAADRAPDRPTNKPTHRKTPNTMAAIAAAVVIGALILLTGRLQHRCAATLRLTGALSADQLAAHRQDLMLMIWNQGNKDTESSIVPDTWFIEPIGSDTLRVFVTSTSREQGVAEVRSLAESFCARVNLKNKQTRENPTENEQWLIHLAGDLQDRLREAQGSMDKAIQALPEENPADQRRGLHEQWDRMVGTFSSARADLRVTFSEMESLEDAGPPEHGVVGAAERENALLANHSLQLDLKQLTVQLTHVKLHMLNVWQTSAGRMESLLQDVDEFLAIAGGVGSIDTASDIFKTLTTYRDTVSPFRDEWNRLFKSIQRQDADPLSDKFLTGYQRARGLLRQLLYDTSKSMTEMRGQIQALRTDPRNDARLHVYQSNMIRGFQTMQTSHHRFEFAASGIEIPDNFRLDAALRSAQGLWRRSQYQIAQIESQLRKKALLRARRERTAQLEVTEASLRNARVAADALLDDILSVGQQLNASAAQSEPFFKALVAAEVASARLELTETDLSEITRRLRELVRTRTQSAESDIEVVEARVIGPPVRLKERLAMAGLAASLTLISMLAGQWWILRRH